MPETTAENKIRYGLCNLYYHPITGYTEGKPTYGPAVKMPGAVSISLASKGSIDTFYADNIAYYITTTNGGYEGDLELARIPDKFREDCLGETVDANEVYTENSDTQPGEFAITGQFEGDIMGKRFVLYRCKASKPDISGKTTEDKTTPDTEKVTVSVMAREDNHCVKSTITKTTANQAAYDAFLTTIYDGAST